MSDGGIIVFNLLYRRNYIYITSSKKAQKEQFPKCFACAGIFLVLKTVKIRYDYLQKKFFISRFHLRINARLSDIQPKCIQLQISNITNNMTHHTKRNSVMVAALDSFVCPPPILMFLLGKKNRFYTTYRHTFLQPFCLKENIWPRTKAKKGSLHHKIVFFYSTQTPFKALFISKLTSLIANFEEYKERHNKQKMHTDIVINYVARTDYGSLNSSQSSG